MVAIIKDTFLVDILLHVDEAAKQKRAGRYFVFIGKVKGGRRGRHLFLGPTEKKGSLVPQATGGRGHIML